MNTSRSDAQACPVGGTGAIRRVVLAGVTGWAGSALARGIVASDDLALVAGVARTAAGTTVGEALDGTESDAPICASLDEALAIPSDVVVEYTKGHAVRRHARLALEAGRSLVIGASGLDEAAYRELDEHARSRDLGVLAVGNFSYFAALLERFATEAAAFAEAFEVFDYAGAAKADAPSGTARELAALLSERARAPQVEVRATEGEVAARGATLDGTQVHSVRLPGFVLSTEVVFGHGDQRLAIRHDAGSGAGAYVPGALLAIRRVEGVRGLARGLGSVMDGP